MKHVFLMLLVTGTLVWGTIASAIPASPHPFAATQPDGTSITLRVRGDESMCWFEDLAGYAVVRDKANTYVYATLDTHGQLEPTDLQVGKADPVASGLNKGLHPLESIIDAALQSRVPPAATSDKAQTAVATTGTVKNLVVLCLFADHTLAANGRPQSEYDILFNSTGGDPTIAPTGSVKDYYSQTSYGLLTLDSTVLAWVTLPQTEAWYANNSYGYTPTQGSQQMCRDALDLIDPLVDFTQFDDDQNGYADCVTFVHSGFAAEWNGNPNWIWSHQWSLYALPDGKWISAEGVSVYRYNTVPALWETAGTEIGRIGVICHELGHMFGLPDLYDTDNTSYGVGKWCLMAGGSWGFGNYTYDQQYPSHPSAWCKLQLGWVVPIVLSGCQVSSAALALNDVERNQEILKFTFGFPSGEYLLVENKQPFGFDSQIPQGGLAIWHVDESKTSNNDEGYPGQPGWPANNNHYKVALLQADGSYHLEHGLNGGDAGDLYHGNGIDQIGPLTSPGTDAYQNGIVYSTNIEFSNISVAGSTMTFDYWTGVHCPTLTPTPSPTVTRTPTMSPTPRPNARPGDVLVASILSQKILRYDLWSGNFQGVFVNTQPFGQIVDITYGPDSNLYVLTGIRRVYRFDGLNGGLIDTFAQILPTMTQEVPFGICFGPDNNLYVNTAENVLRFDGTTGAFIDFLISGDHRLLSPKRMVFGPDENLYITQGAADIIVRFNGTTGDYMDDFAGCRAYGVVPPFDLAFRPDGYLYVSGFSGPDVVRYDSDDGIYLDTYITTEGSANVYGMAFGPEGSVFVSCYDTDSVLRYSQADGTFLGTFIPPGSGGLDYPGYMSIVPGLLIETPTPTPTFIPTTTPSSTPTFAPPPTNTPVPPTVTPTPSVTPTSTQTITPMPTSTVSPTPTQLQEVEHWTTF